MDRKEELRKTYVAMLNTLVPELSPWIHERIAKGQNAYQTLAEFKIALGVAPPTEVLQALAQARPSSLAAPSKGDLTSVSDVSLLGEIARRLRDLQSAQQSAQSTKKAAGAKGGPSFAPQIASQIVQQAQVVDLSDSAP